MLQYNIKLISDYEFSKLLERLDEMEIQLNEKIDVNTIEVQNDIRRIEIKNSLFLIILDTYGQAQLKGGEFDFKCKCFGKVFYKNNSIQEFELYDTMMLYHWWEKKLLKVRQSVVDEGIKLLGWNPKFMFEHNL